ncbi:MAG: sulfatase-like hydrolase/transferase [Deltaproteobacteria bacterium]|nr:sulfatase-like hydrolase/transferase [Deltaproteobacteria bacterium]
MPIKQYQSTAVSTGVIFAGSHFLFSCLIQLENYFFYVADLKNAWREALLFLVTLPFFQFENIAVFAVLASACMLILKIRGTLVRAALLGLWMVLNLYLIFDQVGYSLFLDHLQPGLEEGKISGLSFFVDSFLKEITPLSYVNIAIILIALRWLYRRLFQTAQPANGNSPHPHRTIFIVAMLAYLSLNYAAWLKFQNYNLEHYPLFSLIHSLIKGQSAPTFPQQILTDYGLPQMGTVFESPGDPMVLSALEKQILETHRKPNIIFIVLESVGSKQLFTGDGTFNASITPNLNGMGDHMVIFDSLYSIYPATVRTHLAMNTGGEAITWGSVYEELDFPYFGETLKSYFKKQNYQTGLVSSGFLDPENMGSFFKLLEYDYFYDPASETARVKYKEQLNSWGLREEYAVNKALAWIDRVTGTESPFFLQLLTSCAHHPYAAPSDFKAPLAGNNRKSRYLNSVFYSDYAIGLLVDALQKKGLLENTLLFITGDHGESFEEWHRGNLFHKLRLYEENVKTFLIAFDAKNIRQKYVSHRVGSVGDMAATLSALVVADGPASFSGRDLFAETFPPQIVFFHKNTLPEAWGLRDGEWKFIVNKTGKKTAELFDLRTDPDEQNNLIERHPGIVPLYDKMIGSWYIATDKKFTGQLKGYTPTGGNDFGEVDVTVPGPKVLAIGYRDASDRFHESYQLNPYQRPNAKIKLVKGGADKIFTLVWISPSGKQLVKDHKIISNWGTFQTRYRSFSLPLEEGSWKLVLKDGDREVLSKTFEVNRRNGKR